MRNWPTAVYHADWGCSPRKRWIAKAVCPHGAYRVSSPVLVGAERTLISRIKAEVGDSGNALVGFDFPIGIPVSYARLVRATDFKTFLLGLNDERFADFYRVCSTTSEISPHRPFYPHRPGGTSHEHLLSALGINNMDELRRQCERKHDGRNAACPLFWTLGANQVGKGAIVGWRDVIAPALDGDDAVKLWPFDGELDDLLRPGIVTIAETYPAEYYVWLFAEKLSGKAKVVVRKIAGSALLEWARSAGVIVESDLKCAVENGFIMGDDAFDAVVGLFGMLEVILGGRRSGEPPDADVKKLEGWILGQSATVRRNS